MENKRRLTEKEKQAMAQRITNNVVNDEAIKGIFDKREREDVIMNKVTSAILAMRETTPNKEKGEVDTRITIKFIRNLCDKLGIDPKSHTFDEILMTGAGEIAVEDLIEDNFGNIIEEIIKAKKGDKENGNN